MMGSVSNVPIGEVEVPAIHTTEPSLHPWTALHTLHLPTSELLALGHIISILPRRKKGDNCTSSESSKGRRPILASVAQYTRTTDGHDGGGEEREARVGYK